jgi:hypothetical protein
MAKIRRTSHAEEWARLDRAAAAAGTSTRAFFSAELDCFSQASHSAGPSQQGQFEEPSRAGGAQNMSKGKGKCKQFGKYDKKHGKGENKGKNKHTEGKANIPHSPRTPPRRERTGAPTRETGEPQETEVKEVKSEQVEEGITGDNSAAEAEADYDRNSPTSSPLPVGTVKEGETRTAPVGPPLPPQYGAGKFPAAGLGFVCSKGITVMAAPEEHHHLFRARPVGNGRVAPCLAGRQVIPLRSKSGDSQVKSSCGQVVAPGVGDQGFRLAQVKGWPIAFCSLERMCQVSKLLVNHLRHDATAAHIDPQGFAPLGEVAIQLQVPVGELLDAVLFSWHPVHEWRFTVEFDELAQGITISAGDEHNWSYLGHRCIIRASRKHSIEVLTTEGITGGTNKGKGKSGKNKYKGKGKGKK